MFTTMLANFVDNGSIWVYRDTRTAKELAAYARCQGYDVGYSIDIHDYTIWLHCYAH